jgi:hypothetical protein
MRNLKHNISTKIKINKDEIKKEVTNLAFETRELFEHLLKNEELKLDAFLEKYYELDKVKKENIKKQ